MIMAPDDVGLPPGVGYQYTTFPQLQDELFVLDDPPEHFQTDKDHKSRQRRVSDTFTFGRRTKQEVRSMQKVMLWKEMLVS